MGKFCTNCGAKLEENQEKCASCGKALKASSEKTSNSNSNTNTQQAAPVYTNSAPKSKVCAGLLGIFLGCFGVHNFYLGFTGKGVAQLLLTLIGWVLCGLGPVAAGIWGLIEGIMLLSGSIDKDANGTPLGD